jgi:hypothetical protein
MPDSLTHRDDLEDAIGSGLSDGCFLKRNGGHARKDSSYPTRTNVLQVPKAERSKILPTPLDVLSHKPLFSLRSSCGC